MSDFPFVAVGLAFALGIATAEPVARAQTSTRLVALPDNPCDLLTQQRMASITRLAVTAVHRVPSIAKAVEAERENRRPDAGTICNYETDSAFVGITVYVPLRSNRITETYWTGRSKYFDTYRGSAQPIPGLGSDAWLSGGADLHVLVGPNEYFVVGTQMYQRQSRELLITIAKAILEQF